MAAEATAKRIVLPAIMDLDALDAVRDTLADALDQGVASVSASAVERVSTNAIFLLMSAAETARRNGAEFSVGDASPAMLAAIERLGLGEHVAGLMKGTN